MYYLRYTVSNYLFLLDIIINSFEDKMIITHGLPL